jgi:hypothetical protein
VVRATKPVAKKPVPHKPVAKKAVAKKAVPTKQSAAAKRISVPAVDLSTIAGIGLLAPRD